MFAHFIDDDLGEHAEGGEAGHDVTKELQICCGAMLRSRITTLHECKGRRGRDMTHLRILCQYAAAVHRGEQKVRFGLDDAQHIRLQGQHTQM